MDEPPDNEPAPETADKDATPNASVDADAEARATPSLESFTEEELEELASSTDSGLLTLLGQC